MDLSNIWKLRRAALFIMQANEHAGLPPEAGLDLQRGGGASDFILTRDNLDEILKQVEPQDNPWLCIWVTRDERSLTGLANAMPTSFQHRSSN